MFYDVESIVGSKLDAKMVELKAMSKSKDLALKKHKVVGIHGIIKWKVRKKNYDLIHFTLIIYPIICILSF